MKALIDTNVLLDILLKRDYDQEALGQLQVMHYYNDVDLWASAKSYCDCFYFLKKYQGAEVAYEGMKACLEWSNVCSLESGDIHSAAEQHWPDFEDCLINISAEKIKADYLITRDKKGFKQSSIPHGDIAEFMAYVSETLHLEYAIEELE